MTGKEENQPLEFIGKVERVLLDLTSFLWKFLVTLLHLAFLPKKLCRSLRDQKGDKLYVGPITFVALLTFLNVKLLRLAYVLFAIFYWSLFTSCDPETSVGPGQFSVLQGIRLPSFEEIILIGLPMLVGLIAVSWLVRMVLLKNAHGYQKELESFACYAVGFMFAIMIVLMLVVATALYFKGALALSVPKRVGWIFMSLPFLWSAILFYRLTINLIPKESLRIQRKGFRQMGLVLGSVLLIIGAVLVAGLIVSPLAYTDVERMHMNDPLIALTFVRFESLTNGTFSLILLARNNSDQPIVIIGDKITYMGKDKLNQGRENYRGWIVREGLNVTPVVILKSKELTPLTISFNQSPEYISRHLSFGSDGIVKFTTISGDGNQNIVHSYIKMEGNNHFVLPENKERK